MSVEEEVARTILDLVNGGDLVATTHASNTASVAATLVTSSQAPHRGRTSSKTSHVERMAKTLRDLAANDPVHDLPMGSYRYVAKAVLETIERGFHLDALPPGATGYISRGQNGESLHKQFRATLTAYASSLGYRVSAVRNGKVRSFEPYALTHNSGQRLWVLAHHTLPTFAATAIEPAYPCVSTFNNPEICLQGAYGTWSFAESRHLEVPLTEYLMSQLDSRDRDDIDRSQFGTVGEALFNFSD